MGVAPFAEYESVLEREELFERCVLSATERSRLLDDFLSVCRWTRVYYTKNARDFARMELRFPALRVVTPAELVKE